MAAFQPNNRNSNNFLVSWWAPANGVRGVDMPVLFFLFIISMIVLSNTFSLKPSLSWGKFQDFVNVIIYGIILNFFLINRFRIEMILLTVVFSVGFYAARGAAQFIVTGGAAEVIGPIGTAIDDRNHLALAIVMLVPLLNYFRDTFIRLPMKLVCLAGIGACVVAVIGTGSRGGVIALGVAVIGIMATSSRKAAGAILAISVFLLVLVAAPSHWWQRVDTIESAAAEDESFRLRMLSWRAHFAAGLERPLTGAGVYALNDQEVFAKFAPEELSIELKVNRGIAAHSIYFQMIGELGIIAFIVYIAMAFLTIVKCYQTVKRSRDHVELRWAANLARMVRVSLFAFFVGGAAISFAFYDVYIILIVVSFALSRVTQETTANANRSVS